MFLKIQGKIFVIMDGYLMKIRKTTEKDLPRIMEIYSYARKFMAEHGNYVHEDNDPRMAFEKIE